MKSKVLKEIIAGVAFLQVFTLLLSILTLVYYPKWKASTPHGQMAGFYREPKNSLDVILLGSCNMYTSFSPVLLYDEYGITGYAFTCPDQELSTSYFYLKDALKRQTPKVVVVEALFFTAGDTRKRETYNRFALDYMPLSLNKIQAAAELAGRESAYMRRYDATATDPLLTFMSYLFPVLRYHSRTDLSAEDLTFFLSDHVSNPTKGNFPYYTLPQNDDYASDVDWVFNKTKISEVASEYFPRIQELCEENGITLVVMKSPNYVRWGTDDTYTGVVREYVEGMGVDFVDLQSPEFNDFIPEDYNASTTLNVQGDRKLTHTMAGYLVDAYSLSPTPLTEAQRAAWDACVENYYAQAEENGMSITPGQISYITNLENAASVRWNAAEGCKSYSVYRTEGHGESFERIADVSGTVYDDADVVSGQGYTYYIVPRDGEDAGQPSGTRYNIFVGMPTNYTAENEDGSIRLNWDPVQAAEGYRLYRRPSNDFTYEVWNKTTDTTYLNSSVDNGRMYYFGLAAYVEEDGVRYESEREFARATPLATPVITFAAAREGEITIRWGKMSGLSGIEVWRRSEIRDEFELYEVIDGWRTQYSNYRYLAEGRNYYYKIVAVAENYDVIAKSEESNTVCSVARTDA